jgi:hypothetical protein
MSGARYPTSWYDAICKDAPRNSAKGSDKFGL